MKIKIIFFALVVSLLSTRCSLDEKIYDTAMTDTFVQGESDIRFVLNGVYSFFPAYNSYKSNLTYQILFGADDFTSTSATYRLFLERTISSSNGYFTSPWSSYYLTINNANSLMESMDKMENISESYKNRIMGELYFLRAFSYFNMVRLYGGVPIHTSSINGGSNFYPVQNTIDEVYTQVLDDFKKASESCLANSKMPAGEFGHATKGAAQSMLSLAYLTYGNYFDLQSQPQEASKYYQLAENYADSVILSNEYSLLPNYADLWDVTKEKNAYAEVIFAIQHTRDATAASASSRGSELAYYTQPSTRYNICGNVTNKAGAGTARIQPWFYDVCSTGDYIKDYRTEVSFITRFKDAASNNERITYPEVRKASEATEQYPYLDKYKDPNGLQARNNENDFFIIRLSEVYLIKAEAENELNGPTADAYNAFNKLRERARKANGTARTTPANLAAGLSKEDFRMKIFDERGLELVGEGHRWFDSVRMRYKDNSRTMIQYRYEEFFPAMTNKTAPVYNATTKIWGGGRVQPLNIVSYTTKFLIWPIPSTEIDSNPNVTQNQGW